MEQKGCTNIKVAIRVRPLIAIEKEKKLRPQWGTQNNIIYQIDENGQKFGELYSFDHIFDMNKRNSEIYDDIVKDFIVSSLDGLNSTIFAYGQTSSGKTYTMLGDKKDTGVMSLAIENIFDIVKNNSNRKYLLRVSYMEIYNEKINDLLDPTNKDVKIREFFPSTIGLQNIKEEIVSTKEQMYDCLKRGNLNRHIGSTKANERSSRSHTIFRIMIESTQVSEFSDSGGSMQVSNLNLVDLAGSERVAQTKATGMRLKEGGHINKSLSALGLVIRQLSDGQEFVNFRDSKLTRLLQDSLGGNSKTLIIATITLASIEDTCSTLAFAQRAKAVKNKPQVNEILTDADVSKRYAALNTQLQRKLEEQLVINQKLQQTHEENIREMTRLQQQMEMLDDFQGKRVPKAKNTPKRRHTIGFSAHKPLFPTLPETNFETDDEDVLNITPFEDLLAKERCGSTLETIMEEDTPLSIDKSSTPEIFLRTRLSALEEEYNELVTYTRDENNVLNETIKKAEKLETQLKAAEKRLLDCQNDQKLEKELLEDKFKKREQDLCLRIGELEEQLQKKTEKSEIGVSNGNIGHIMDQLICLQDILNSSDFINDFEETRDKDSVLEIIEKFNLKVKTSKDIIESEILKQMSNFDHNLQEKIILPNELASFNDLLNELSLFETDIPVDLINNMKREGIEDLKILIKVYESLLRKNELLGRCLEKIKLLEDQRVKNETNNNELRNEILEKTKLISETQNNGDDASKQALEDTIEENQSLLDQIHHITSNYERCKLEMDDLKLNIEKSAQELTEKSKIISELENNCLSLKHENERLREDFSGVNQQYARLKNEHERIKADNDSVLDKIRENQDLLSKVQNLQSIIETYKLDINKSTQELTEKTKMLSELDNNYLLLKEENERLRHDFLNVNSQYVQLKNENEQIKCDNESYCKELEAYRIQINTLSEKENDESIKRKVENKTKLKLCLLEQVEHLKRVKSDLDDLKGDVDKLMLEVIKKNKIIAELENNCAKFKLENEKLKEKASANNSEIASLKEEIELIKTKSEDYEVFQNKISNLSSEILEKNERIRGLEDVSKTLTQKIDNLLQEYAVLSQERIVLTEENAKLLMSNELCGKELNELRNKINSLNLEVVNKEEIVAETQKSCALLLQDKEKLLQQLTNQDKDKESLFEKIEEMKMVVDSQSKKLKDLSLDVMDKNKVLKEAENSYRRLEEEKENLIKELSDIFSENQLLRQEVEKTKTDGDSCNKRISSFQSEITKLNSQLSEKNANISRLEQASIVLRQEIDRLKEESSGILAENKTLKNEINSLQSDNDKLNSQLSEKNASISKLEQGCIVLKQEIDRLKKESSGILAENKTLKNEINSLQSDNDKLRVQVAEQKKIVCEIQQSSTNLKLELADVKQKSENTFLENKHLKSEIQKLKSEIEDFQKGDQKVNDTESRIQTLKQSLKAAKAEIIDLKLSLREKDKLKNEISQYKGQILRNNIRQQQLTNINDQLCTQLNELEQKLAETNEKNINVDAVKEQEIITKELRRVKEKFEDVLCSIIEHFVNEQKTLLLIRHSQDERDYFKSILKDIKTSNGNLKNQLILLRNRSDYDLNTIATSLLNSQNAFKQYSNSENLLKQKQIEQLDASNKAYLQEIMAIKAQNNASSTSECSSCDAQKEELSRLSKLTQFQEEMLGSLKNKNSLLGKENVDRMRQIVDLQTKIYEEQDRKAEVQYTDWLKFCQENDKMQQQQIQNLQRKIEQYQNAATQNKQSVEVQCDINSVQEKYRIMKSLCISRKQKIAALQSENAKLKNSLGIKTDDETINETDVPATTASVEVQCDLGPTQEKYNVLKNICMMRKQKNGALESEIIKLKNKLGIKVEKENRNENDLRASVGV